MLRTYLMSAFLVAPLGACASSQKKSVAETEAPPAIKHVADAPRETVEGELRDALLVLRRVHFAYDSARLEPAAKNALAAAAEPLKRHPDVHLHIDGHADARGTSAYNRALGERRAAAVTEALARLGVERHRLHVNTFGKDKLLVGGGGVIAHATNRRVDFRLMRGDVNLVLEEGVLFDDRGRLIEGRTAGEP
ncbi:MAG: OmpA family protein [Deltaproteobacteria bacterium]|nr:OmpA family protein [Deltaproteobacteria bacterium]